MIDWTDNASQELKAIIDAAMETGMHEDFDNFHDFLHMCVDHYEERNQDNGSTMSELKTGMRVRFTQDVECYPHTIVKAGETGTITHLDLKEKRWHNIEVLLDKHHEGFDEWDNKLHMSDDNNYNDMWPSIYLNCIPI